MANFLALCNGNIDNLAQYQADNKSHDYIQARNVPVTTPALPGQPVIFNEYSLNGAVFNLYLCGLTEDSNGIIHMAIYNLTHTRQYKPGEYNVENLSKLTPEDIQRPSHCSAVIEPDGPGVFIATWQLCRHNVQGRHPLYTGIVTCDVIKEIVPRSATEESSSIPYTLIRRGDRFKVPDLPTGFVSPCA